MRSPALGLTHHNASHNLSQSHFDTLPRTHLRLKDAFFRAVSKFFQIKRCERAPIMCLHQEGERASGSAQSTQVSTVRSPQ